MLRVYDKSFTNEDIYLKLVSDTEGRVDLIVTDNSGIKVRCGRLLSIGLDGIKFYDNIDPDSGFALDQYGSLTDITQDEQS